MLRIGLISDTHRYFDDKIAGALAGCDEVWHAGDIGSVEVLDQLEEFEKLRVVYGNIDSADIRARTQEHLRFDVEGFSVWMTHIGGAPPRYNPAVKPALTASPPDIFVCGHSHILRVKRDPAMGNMLYLNPGAAGKEGFHKIRTLLRFTLDSGKISAMEVVELGKRGAIT